MVRADVYCLVPPDLADELLEPLREHFAGEPGVAVIVDRRVRRRRSGADRRALLLPAPESVEKRERRDRRVSPDRRSPALPRKLTLPDVARPHAKRIRFSQRLPAVSRGGVDSLTLEELVEAIRAGHPEAPTEFYWRMFERAYSRLRSVLGRYARPDDHMAGTFGALLDRIDEWEPGGDRSFDDWFYAALDEHAATLPREPGNPLVRMYSQGA